ncbi:hypothetical protein MASR1M31_03630 [Porphyromonadaceae bacterium]
MTDGNSSGHLKALEKEEYIAVEKSFIDKKPNNCYSITPRKEGIQRSPSCLRRIDSITEIRIV